MNGRMAGLSRWLRRTGPVAQGGLDQGQGRDRRRVGPQDARPQRQPHQARLPQQIRAFLIGKAAFRADQDVDASRTGFWRR